jgi:hypothetical protein
LPVATVSDHSLQRNEWARMDAWISYTDGNGQAATKYQFWDGLGGTNDTTGYFWTPGNERHAAHVPIEVATADLATVWARGGTAGGSENMYVRAFDGDDWGAWDTFALTTIPSMAPVATIGDRPLLTKQWAQIDSWISYTDGNGQAATKYQFWDGFGGTNDTTGYFWTPGNERHAAHVPFEVAAADLNTVWVRGGTAGGTDNMYVRAFDGEAWGAWDPFMLQTIPNAVPVAVINEQGLQINEWVRINTWINYVDGNGQAATKYQFWDEGHAVTSGYFWTPDNDHHAAGAAFEVAAADLGNVWLRGGSASGAETMYVRAFDGLDWSAWDMFTSTTF